MQLYDQLLVCTPTPVVALNRAVAVAEMDGPGVALVLTDALAADLDQSHLFHATRGNLLARLGRPAEAALAYERALELTTNHAERRFLEERRAALGM